ncbi:MAG: arginine--tRNA ligase [Gammaproteobacteria bacterium]
MKARIRDLMQQAVDALQQSGALALDAPADIQIENTRDPAHGDFACNLAMMLAKRVGKKPRELAEQLVAALPSVDWVAAVEIAGPGFLNFRLADHAWQGVVAEVFAAGEAFGHSTVGAEQSVCIEFVSANPTGPLHVGHGRGAAYGAAVADLLAAVGFHVHREYYVNDAGRQMDILATSVWLRYLDLCGETLTFPSNGYQGDYIWDIAASLHREHADTYRMPAAEVFADVPADEPAGGDKELHIDGLIAQAKARLGAVGYEVFFARALETILGDIREDLREFGVVYEDWFSERSLTQDGTVDAAIARLQQSGQIYEDKGALWFRSTGYGDEKDRVVVRENGLKTYFASDIAYHMHKLDRGYARVIDVWGADHHGYVPRVKAAIQAMGGAPEKLDVLLVQFASLYRGGEKVAMSTRSGSFVTLRELREEVGNDAARFFYVQRKCEQHMDFDLDLAKSQSADNPVYYIQYAHARVHSVMRQLAERGMTWEREAGLQHLHLLQESHEKALLQRMNRFPEVVENAALAHEPHQLAHYLRELANDLHTYYNAHKFIVEEAGLRDARLCLINATRQVLANGLGLLGVSAPETM